MNSNLSPAEGELGNHNQRISNLSPAKRALLEARLRGEKTDTADTYRIPRRPDGTEAVLSFSQERLWFLAQLEPESSYYNRPTALRLTGPLDFSVLEKSLLEICRRHDALRTIFPAADGKPLQVVLPVEPLNIRVVKVVKNTDEARDAHLNKLIAREVDRPFDLAKGPTIRLTLFHLDKEEHVLLFLIHHLLFDSWSSRIFIKELMACYQAFTCGNQPLLPDLPIQYVDYAVWQRRRLLGQALDRQLDYWKRKLKGAPVLELPTDRPRPAIQTYRGHWHFLTIPKPLVESLRALGEREEATLFMTLLAAFYVLLYRYSGSEDILVGTPLANRNQAELEGMIGYFINPVVLRMDLSRQPSFTGLLSRTKQMCLEALTYPDLPWERVLEELKVERDLSRHPLFQVMFQLQNAPVKPDTNSSCLKVDEIKVPLLTSKFDLSFTLQETETGLSGALNGNADLFDPETLERMADHYLTLLEGIVGSPDQKISHLPLLTERERQQILIDFNRDRFPMDLPDGKIIPDLIEEQVEKTPDRTAVLFTSEQGQEETLTYRQLNEKANQLAHYLREQYQIRPDDIVALQLERSEWIIIGILGVLKAGAAYLPIDPHYPPSRVSFMLKDSRPKVLLTDEAGFNNAKEAAGSILPVAAIQSIRSGNRTNPLRISGPENLVYVIYTSGSTGRPKGVLIELGSLMTRVQFHKLYYGLRESDIILAFRSFCFDGSVEEYLLPFVVGAAACILPSGKDLHLLESIIDQIDRQQITLLHGPPILIDQFADHLLEHDEASKMNSLQTIISGGEKLSRHIIKKIRTILPEVSFFNAYGPSENTNDTCIGKVNFDREDVVPIGKPVDGTNVYILDQYLQPVPVGIPGELCTSGTGLARGYLNAPALTEEKFIPHPFLPGERLYKTGDLARWLPDGNVDFLGRVDHQLKIRGFRVEPGEIEWALDQHPGISQAAVIGRTDGSGSQQLVAYIVTREGEEPAVQELRQFLQHYVPQFMIPSAFMFLDKLPVNTNGKLDRQALPEPDRTRPDLKGEYVGPRNPVEERLAAIWAEVLHLDQISVHDDFFELGGHSLLATQIISRTRKTFDADTPLRWLFESPTIANLGRRIQQTLESGTAHPIAPGILPVNRSGDLPLSIAQQRLWFIEQLEPNLPTYTIPSAVRLQGPLDTDALERSLNELLNRHEVFRTSFITKDGEASVSLAPVVTLELPLIDLQHLPEADRLPEAKKILDQEAKVPFDLSRGPLFRAGLYRLGEEDHLLFLHIHHIIYDEWSGNIFRKELSACYNAFSSGNMPRLSELPIQYVDYAVWQRQWLQGKVLETQLDYWKAKLNAAPTLELPTDHPRPAMQSYRGAYQSVSLPKPATKALLTLCEEEEVTLFMTLLAALNTLFYRYSGTEDILVGSPITNRNASELEGLIGFFVNTILLRTDLSNNPAFSELLKRVKQVCLEAFSHQDLPWEKLLEELQVERDMSRQALFQVLFVLNNASQRVNLEFNGLELTNLRVNTQTAKFDLTIVLGTDSGQLKGAIVYNVDLFEPDTIRRMARHLEILLEGIIADRDRRISELPLMPEEERNQVLHEFSGGPADDRFEKSIVDLFEEQVEKTPGRTALIVTPDHRPEIRLTYRQLNEQANRLAHYLRDRHRLQPDDIVALQTGRSEWMIIALLGVLKAGAAYLPIDPDAPPARAAYLIRDSRAKLLLAHGQISLEPGATFADLLPVVRPGQVPEGPAGNPERISGNRHLAYVIYTSGSTGQPKGVMVEHRSLANYIHTFSRYFSVTQEDVALQLANISFDTSIEELFPALCAGGTVVVTKAARDFDQVLADCEIFGVTILSTNPYVLNYLNQSPDRHAFAFRVLISGGDVLKWEHLSRLVKRYDIYNTYGPTESTVCATYHKIEAPTENIPIGRPNAHTEVFILDLHQQLLPIGIPGELCVAGVGLARGYLNNPEGTAEKFIAHPFRKGKRLYRTGDRARWLPDGNIEFLGRVDQQLKIRGFRVEPAEVEWVLRQHPGVGQVTVAGRTDERGGQRLIAYFVPCGQGEITPDTLRQFLQQQLPQYMIPSAYVRLDEIPLTPNGKLDLGALPAPETAPRSTEAFTKPRTLTEELVAQVWTEVLDLPLTPQFGPSQIDIHRNFFESGGHSLVATQLISRLRKVFKVDLPLRRLFEYPTISGLAACIESERQVLPTHLSPTNNGALLAPIQAGGTKKPFFLIPGGGGGEEEFLIYAKLIYQLGKDQPVYGLQARGLDGQTDPHFRVEDMARDYLREIKKIQPQGPYLIGGECIGGVVAYEMAQQLIAQGEDVALLVLMNTFKPERKEAGALNLAQKVRKKLPLRRMRRFIRHLSRLNGKEKWSLISGTLAKRTKELLSREARHVAITRQNYQQTMIKYKPEPYPGKLLLLLSEDHYEKNPTFGWQGMAKQGLEVCKLSGDHDSYLGVHVKSTAERLKAALEEAQPA